MTNLLQQSPYLRNQRKFPSDNLQELSSQIDNAYIDIASKVNYRTIGIFANDFSAITGETWILEGQSNIRQSLRRVYEFTSSGTFPHELNFDDIDRFTKPSGTYLGDDGNYYGIVYAGINPIVDQASFYITSSDIVIILDGAAPAIVEATIILEWLSIL